VDDVEAVAAVRHDHVRRRRQRAGQPLDGGGGVVSPTPRAPGGAGPPRCRSNQQPRQAPAPRLCGAHLDGGGAASADVAVEHLMG
jgi:hypothetical protein